jgi:light-regulated signal transduction histidine kinase (bacteriophytochrome)
MVHDITQHKQAEERIAQLNINLEERAASLQAVNQELEAFNYTVAHDLRQPLNLINSACQVMDRLCGDSFPAECVEYLHMIYRSTLRMDRLIEALLTFSSMAHAEPCREHVNLSELVDEVAQSLKQAEPDRKVEFRIASGVFASCDAGLLRVVFENLLGNAWKHTRKRPHAVIEFVAEEKDGVTRYLVRDNGDGFDVAEAAQLFQPFRRLEKAAGEKGFGIGLATVDRVIRRHGGEIWAEGRQGEGATFFFTLS